MRALIDRGLFTPPQAQAAGLVDGVADQGQLEMVIARALGRPDVGITDLETGADRAGRLARPARRASCWSTAPSSTAPARSCRSASAASPGRTRCCRRWRSAATDSTVGAVVLRVNSPGGSAFASDVIARAIVQLRAAGKPVIVSMGDMAASGGYYISAPADVVFAEPSTMTGSIGIFAIKVNAAQAGEHAGHQRRDHHRGAHADYLSPYRPWTEAEVKMVMDKMRYLYGQFIETVAEGRASRGLTVARVDELGRGQVWTGALAQSVGLVDGWAAWPTRSTRRCAAAGIPVGRDRMPEMMCCRARRWTWFDVSSTGARRRIGAAPAPAQPVDARAAARRPSCAPRCGCSRRRCSAAAPASRPGCPTTSTLR